MPGKVENHHASRRYWRPSAIITPQSGVGRLGAETDEAERGRRQHGEADVHRRFDQDRGEGVGQDMREEDAAAAGPDRLRGFRELGVAQGDDVRPCQPAVARPPDERDGDHHIEKPRTERGGEGHGQDQVGDGEEDVGQRA